MIGLGSSSTLGLGVAIYLKDFFSANATKVNQSFTNLQRGHTAAMRGNTSALVAVGAGALVAGAMITRSFKGAVDQAAEFRDNLNQVKALSQEANFDTQALAKNAFDLSKKYGVLPIEITKGYKTLVQAGVQSAIIPDIMEAIVATSKAANEEIGGEGGVATGMIRMLAGWNMPTTKEAINKMADTMAYASVKTTLSFSHIKESMDYGQDVFRNMGLSFEESVALITTLGSSVRGSRAGIALSQGWIELVNASSNLGTSKKKKTALSAIGLDAAQLKAALLKGPIQTLDLLKKHLVGVSDTVEKQKILGDLFGRRGGRAANPLLDFLEGKVNYGQSLKQMVTALEGGAAKGYTEKVVKTRMESYVEKINLFNAAISRFKISVGDALLPFLTKVVVKLTDLMDKFGIFIRTDFGQTVVKLIAFAGVVLMISGGLTLLYAAMGPIISVLGVLGTGLSWLGSIILPFFSGGFTTILSMVASAFGRIYFFLLPVINGFSGLAGFMGSLLSGFGILTGALFVLDGIFGSLENVLNGVIWVFKDLQNSWLDFMGFLNAGDGRNYNKYKTDNKFTPSTNEHIRYDKGSYQQRDMDRLNNLIPGMRNKGQVGGSWDNKPTSMINIFLDGKQALAQQIDHTQEQNIYSKFGYS